MKFHKKYILWCYILSSRLWRHRWRQYLFPRFRHYSIWQRIGVYIVFIAIPIDYAVIIPIHAFDPIIGNRFRYWSYIFVFEGGLLGVLVVRWSICFLFFIHIFLRWRNWVIVFPIIVIKSQMLRVFFWGNIVGVGSRLHFFLAIRRICVVRVD